MAWIMSDQSLGRHPKTKKLARLLSITIPSAIGHLHMLWWWALDYAHDGNISKFDPDDIANAMEWKGDTQVLIDSLVQSGFVDKNTTGGDLCIHDWDEYGGKLFENRKKASDRTREYRNRKKAEKIAEAEAAKAAIFSRLSPEDAKKFQKHTGITPHGT